MSTIVGTNIEVTNIKFDSDTTSMIISNTGQITAQGEGTNTTNLQQGLAKHWCQFVQSSASVRDSLNQSSMVDNGTGDSTWNFTTAMGNDDYSSQMTCNSGSWYVTSAYNDGTKTTTTSSR